MILATLLQQDNSCALRSKLQMKPLMNGFINTLLSKVKAVSGTNGYEDWRNHFGDLQQCGKKVPTSSFRDFEMK